jgi:hypothetical protein
MTQISLCCTNDSGTILDRRLVKISNLDEAREYAVDLIRSSTANANLRDSRKCRVHVQDELGHDIFVMPFWSTLRRPTLKSRLKAGLSLGGWR